MSRTTPTMPARSTSGLRRGLVGVELRRLRWRRLTKALLVLTVLFTGVTVFGAYQSSSPDNLAQQLADYRQAAEEFPRMLADCRQAEAQAREDGTPQDDFDCSTLTPPTLQDYGLESPEAAALTVSLARANGFLYAFLAFVLGASFVGAEYTSGSLGTWLTFEPRRLRVGAGKLVAAGVGGAVITAVGLALTALGAWLVSRVNQPDPGLALPPGTGAGESVTQVVLRGLAVGIVGGLIGVALAFIVRNTGAVVAVVLGYAVVVEGVLAQGLGHGRFIPWLPMKNLEAFLQGGTTYFAERCTAQGCQYEPFTLSYTHGWVYVSVFVVALLAVALWLFRRRDVG
ncbi:ABC transporter permease subunit [Intrasporangium sp.]|uniref:ABC transporter permease subunit n=1 Tax=Intrasporangium sp. TaxID=1925024 RepID=UPI003221F25D